MRDLRYDFSYLWSVGIALLFRGAAAVASFVLTFISARLLEMNDSGLFFLFIGLMSLFSVISRLGLGPVVTRFVASHSRNNDWAAINALVGKVLLIVGVVSCFASVLIFLAADVFSEYVFREQKIRSILRYGVLVLMPFSCLWVLAHANQGLHSIGKMLIYNTLGVTSVTIVMLLVYHFFFDGPSPKGKISLNVAALLYCGACVIVFFVSLFDWYVCRKKTKLAAGESARELLALGMPLYATGVLAIVLQTANQQLLAIWQGGDQVAIYTVAFRVAALMSLMLTAMTAISAPKIASSYAEGDLVGVRKEAARMNATLMIASVPMLFFLLIFAKDVLLIFGETYAHYEGTIRTLAVAQFVVMLAGSVGTILTMTGHSKYNARANFVSLCFLLFFGLLLIPKYGAFGAAIGFLSAVLCQMFMNVSVVHSKFGFIPACDALKIMRSLVVFRG